MQQIGRRPEWSEQMRVAEQAGFAAGDEWIGVGSGNDGWRIARLAIVDAAKANSWLGSND